MTISATSEKGPGPDTIPGARNLAPDHSLLIRQLVVPLTERAGRRLPLDPPEAPAFQQPGRPHRPGTRGFSLASDLMAGLGGRRRAARTGGRCVPRGCHTPGLSF